MNAQEREEQHDDTSDSRADFELWYRNRHMHMMWEHEKLVVERLVCIALGILIGIFFGPILLRVLA